MKYSRIYAYTTQEVKDFKWTGERVGRGLIKIGQTTNLTAVDRIKQQLQGSPLVLINNLYEILIDEEALRNDGTYYKDTDVHKVLKAMKVKRLTGTEWFECSLQEVKYAIGILKSGGTARNIASSFKDTSQKRQVGANDGEAAKERKQILLESNILKVMQTYKGATSNIKIAESIVRFLKIKQYSYTTISVLIGPIIKKLLKEGVIINKGTSRNPVLEAVKSGYVEDPEVTKSTFTSSSIIPFLETKLYGAAIRDFQEYFQVNECISSLHDKLERVSKKVNVRNKEGRVFSRFFSPYKNIKIPENESIECIVSKDNLKNKTSRTQIKKKLDKALKRMYTKVLVSGIFTKQVDLKLLEKVINSSYLNIS